VDRSNLHAVEETVDPGLCAQPRVAAVQTDRSGGGQVVPAVVAGDAGAAAARWRERAKRCAAGPVQPGLLSAGRAPVRQQDAVAGAGECPRQPPAQQPPPAAPVPPGRPVRFAAASRTRRMSEGERMSRQATTMAPRQRAAVGPGRRTVGGSLRTPRSSAAPRQDRALRWDRRNQGPRGCRRRWPSSRSRPDTFGNRSGYHSTHKVGADPRRQPPGPGRARGVGQSRTRRRSDARVRPDKRQCHVHPPGRHPAAHYVERCRGWRRYPARCSHACGLAG